MQDSNQNDELTKSLYNLSSRWNSLNLKVINTSNRSVFICSFTFILNTRNSVSSHFKHCTKKGVNDGSKNIFNELSSVGLLDILSKHHAIFSSSDITTETVWIKGKTNDAITWSLSKGLTLYLHRISFGFYWWITNEFENNLFLLKKPMDLLTI